MTSLEIDLSVIFVIAIILIWFTIAYQFILTVFGYINFVRSDRERQKMEAGDIDLPSCSILIPAHNEERVIGTTLEAMTRLVYPDGRLSIIVVNDGSGDATKSIVESFAARDPRVKLFNVPPEQGGKGKSRALNLGLREVTSDLVAIYDADNTPDPDALRQLATQLITHKDLGAVIGKFRTINKHVNLLTRFINIETLSFQSILQAGRWQMHNIATLPGTNFVMWTWLIRELDGWDEDALTEDFELSIRMYQRGYKIKFIPYATTYEQEPQEWKVWVRQRMRWVRGNNYVMSKFFKQIPKFANKRLAFDILYTLALYYVFFTAIIVSDLLFILGAAGFITMPLPGPYTAVWILAFLLFVAEIMLAISYDGEDSVRNLLLILLMYFTYCQLWVYVVIKAFYIERIKKEGKVWDKTVRFEVLPKEDGP